MSTLAIVDIPKQDGSPVLQLPEDAVTRKHGDLWMVFWSGEQAFLWVLKSTATRWIAFVAAPSTAYQWLENRLGADIYPVTPALVTNQRTALESLGLAFDEDGRLLAPHVICGQRPWVTPE